MYVAACGALGFAAFGFWKASHRGGMSFWQATVRPALICFSLAFAAAALAFERIIAPQTLQIVGLIVAACAFATFMFVWQLRGAHMHVQSGDAYWHGKWMNVFIALTLFFAAGAIITGGKWAGDDFRSVVANADYVERTIEIYRRSGPVSIQRRFPIPVYNHNAVFFAIFSLLAIGSAGEAYHRRKRAMKAAGVLGDES